MCSIKIAIKIQTIFCHLVLYYNQVIAKVKALDKHHLFSNEITPPLQEQQNGRSMNQQRRIVKYISL